MYELYRELVVKTTRDKAWDFIKDPANLNKITPNDLSFELWVIIIIEENFMDHVEK